MRVSGKNRNTKHKENIKKRFYNASVTSFRDQSKAIRISERERERERVCERERERSEGYRKLE